MSKYANDLMLDAALDYVRDNCAKMTLCNAQPATYADATTNYALAETTLITADIDALSDSTGGRKLVIPEKSGVNVDDSDIATHVAIVSAAALLYVTTCVDQSLTLGNEVTIPSWNIEIKDPA